jgi:hypothetical protein
VRDVIVLVCFSFNNRHVFTETLINHLISNFNSVLFKPQQFAAFKNRFHLIFLRSYLYMVLVTAYDKTVVSLNSNFPHFCCSLHNSIR